jgi:hypothetical protein
MFCALGSVSDNPDRPGAIMKPMCCGDLDNLDLTHTSLELSILPTEFVVHLCNRSMTGRCGRPPNTANVQLACQSEVSVRRSPDGSRGQSVAFQRLFRECRCWPRRRRWRLDSGYEGFPHMRDIPPGIWAARRDFGVDIALVRSDTAAIPARAARTAPGRGRPPRSSTTR